MQPRSKHLFFGLSALLFAGSAAQTVRWSMAMPGMGVPGGMEMRMPGQDWPGAAITFLAMWMVMMAAMMLPSLAPALWRYREAVRGTHQAPTASLILMAGGGYFFVWLLFGIAVFPLAPLSAAIQMHWTSLARTVPAAVATLVVIAGLLQFTRWKAYHLACCRQELGEAPAGLGAAWRHGLKLGLHCSFSSIGPTAILLAAGMMNLWAMALATAVITVERLAPKGERIVRMVGIATVAAGLVLLVAAAP